MAKFLDTRGKPHLTVAICDRCGMKFPYDDLYPDPNYPGLRVCAKDRDLKDPYSGKQRDTEKIDMRYPRPDVDITIDPNISYTSVNGGTGVAILPGQLPGPVPAPSPSPQPAIVLPEVTPLTPAVPVPAPAPPPVYVPPTGGGQGGIPIGGPSPTPTPTAAPTPGPTPSPSPTPAPSGGPTPAPTPTPTPTPAPTPSPTPAPYDGTWPYGRDPSGFVAKTFFDEFSTGTAPSTGTWEYSIYYESNNPVVNYDINGGALRIWMGTSGGVPFNRIFTTRNHFTQQYGYIEFEAKLPSGPGEKIMLGLLLDEYKDIGVMHAYTSQPGWTDSNGHPNTYTTDVFDIPSQSLDRDEMLNLNTDLTAGFNKFALEWTPNNLRWFFNGVQVGSQQTEAITGPFYPYIGLADDPDYPTTAQTSANAFTINYVRMWSLKNNANSNPYGTSAPTPAPTPTPTSPYAPIIEMYGDGTLYGVDGANFGALASITIGTKMQSRFNGDNLANWTVNNHGVSGNTTKYLLAGTAPNSSTFAATLAALPSKRYVILEGNVNEYTQLGEPAGGTYTTAQYTTDLGAAVDAILAAGHYPILMAAPEVNDTGPDPFKDVMLSVASAKNVPVINLWQYSHDYRINNGLTFADMVPDDFHPTGPSGAGLPYPGNGYEGLGNYAYDRFLQISGTTTSNVGNNPNPQIPGGDAALVGAMSFREDFNGSSLNTTYWYDSMPFEYMGQSGTSYANPDFNTQNWNVSNGCLNIWPLVNSSGSFFRKTISTGGKFQQKFGYFEARMKLPSGLGCWPAFWLWDGSTAARPEIDIMEAYSGGGTITPWGDASNHPVNYGATVWDSDWNNGNPALIAGYKLTDYRQPQRLDDSFHVYGALVTPTYIKFYFDGTQLGPTISCTDKNYNEMIILDLWYGNASGPPSISGTPQGPGNSFSVDYVYAWRMADGSSTFSGTAPVYGSSPSPSPTPSPTPGPTPSPGPLPTVNNLTGTYTLTFQDEFDSGSLDTTKWNKQIWYKSAVPDSTFNVSSGTLNFWVDPVAQQTRHFTTRGKFSQYTGFFEARIKFPTGSGTLPAFWLLYSEGEIAVPNSGEPELDIVEVYPGGGSFWALPGKKPYKLDLSWHTLGAGAIPGTDNGSITKDTGIALSDDYHVYGVKFEQNQITYYFDGNVAGTVTKTMANVPYYIILSLQTATEDSFVGETAGSVVGSEQGSFNPMQVDYVRAWKFGGSVLPPAPAPTPAPTPSPTPSPSPGPTPAPTPSPTPAPGSSGTYPYGRNSANYTPLTFEDTFDGTVLDFSKWSPNTVFTSDFQPRNFDVSGGNLRIWPDASTGYANRTLWAANAGQNYGYFEARMRLNVGRGCWPIFWLYGPGGEIDIMEAYCGGSPSVPWADTNLHPVNYAMGVTGSYPISSTIMSNYLSTQDLSSAFHIYGCEWSSTGVTFFLDGVQVGPKVVTNLNTVLSPMVSLWFGSVSGTPNTVETPSGVANAMLIDYVRIWQLKNP